MRAHLAPRSLILVALVPGAALAQQLSVDPLFVRNDPAAATAAASAPPLRLAEALIEAPRNRLRPAREASIGQLEALTAWNRSGRRPARNGFSRPLLEPDAVRLDLGLLESSPLSEHGGGIATRSLAGDLVWGTAIQVESAYRLRLELGAVDLPEGTRMWVYGLGDERPVEFGPESRSADGALWTPSVAGDWLHLEVEVPRASLSPGARYGFTYERVLELVRLRADGSPELETAPGTLGDCVIDATCVGPSTLDVIDLYRFAIAHLEFVVNEMSYICSGGLLNDTDLESTEPYLLTANHCIGSQSTADTLEAFWQYRTGSCSGDFPPLSSLPRTLGGTVLAMGGDSDFTFLRLDALPPTYALLGWDANPSAVPEGTVLHRISHPLPSGMVPYPQSYSRSAVTTTSLSCLPFPRPDFLYSEGTAGAPFPGSSGAPVVKRGGYVVGQLTGICGPDPYEPCDYENLQMDGAFSETFPHISPWLSPEATTDPCEPDATTLCIDDQPGDGRFKVRIYFENAQNHGFAHAMPLSSLEVNRGGLFWIGSPTNPEMLIKVLNACVEPFNAYWVFYAATTNQGLEATVTDTQTGRYWSRSNPMGTAAAPIQDTSAFPCE